MGRSRRKAGAPKVWLLTIAASAFIAQFTIPSFAQEGRKIRMAYSAFSVAFLNIFVAQDAGLFKKQALDVELIQMAGPLPITSGLVAHEAKIKSDAARIKTVIRVMLDSLTFSQREKGWMTNYVKDKWKLDAKVAQTVYEQWLSTLAPDGKVNPKELQEYFDLAYSFKQIPALVHVPAVTDYTLLDQVLAGK
jgi:hypothetical protein